MEFLVIEYPLIKDSEVHYFRDGIEVSDRVEVNKMKSFFIKLSQEEDPSSRIVEIRGDEIHYTCYTTIPPIEERRKPIVQRIEYFIKARENGSVEFVHVHDEITKKDYTLLYNNGYLDTNTLNVRFEDKGKLVEKYPQGKFQIAIYSTNIDEIGNLLTFPEYIFLIKKDISIQLKEIGQPRIKPLRDTKFNRPHPKYDDLILKRIGDVVCLSNGLVKHFEISSPAYAFLKMHENDLYISFLDFEMLDTSIIQYKINLTRYARRPLVDGANFPYLIYYSYRTGINLTEVLYNEEEYKIDDESIELNGIEWYLVYQDRRVQD